MPEWLIFTYRALASIIFLFLVTKLIGKRQLSQMTFFEYTVGIAIGQVAGFIATDVDSSMLNGALTLVVYALFTVGLGWLALKSKIVRNIVEGKSTVLIKDGKVMEDNLKKERMTTEELMEHLRLKNAFKVADVEFALMETNGTVSVLLKSDNQPLTPKSLGIRVNQESEPQAVIMDGTIMDESLATIGLNRAWLKGELDKQGIALENVYLGQVDSIGQLYVDLYDDKLQVPQPQETKLLYATLKKCQADLEMYALSTKSMRAKLMYEREAKKLQQTMESIEPFLMR